MRSFGDDFEITDDGVHGFGVRKDKKEPDSEEIKEVDENFIEDQEEETSDGNPKTYQEILKSCGQSTMCQIRRGDGYLIWMQVPIAYQHFKEYPGHYIEHTGYFMQMDLDSFFLFLGLNDYEIRALEQQSEEKA